MFIYAMFLFIAFIIGIITGVLSIYMAKRYIDKKIIIEKQKVVKEESMNNPKTLTKEIMDEWQYGGVAEDE